jgi:hypothetical protein
MQPESFLEANEARRLQHGSVQRLVLMQVFEVLKGGVMGTILLIILILLLVGALPTWPHSSGWGYYPSGGLGLILLILIILLLMGRI